MSLGPVMLDLEGPTLLDTERERLTHPLVGGVILFSRNYTSPEQLSTLVSQIKAVRSPPLLVSVDHEGGRVQRFREHFTELPPVARLGEIYEENKRRAKHLAELTGWLMASELRHHNVDFSFAPVLDLGLGLSEVIGDRAFHANPEIVADLAHSYVSGMSRAGMAAVGKHFPGHGSVAEDSHHAIPYDNRDFIDISNRDLIPFERLIHFGIPALMPAHVIYPKIDPNPAGFSDYWLGQVLRQQLGFEGLIFSDDLSMQAATVIDDVVERARLALTAGCDMILVCNDPNAAAQVLDNLSWSMDPASLARFARMHGRQDTQVATALPSDAALREAKEAVRHYA